MKRWEAGAAYLKALDDLGMRPMALFWADDAVVGRKVLVVITDFFDYAGTLAISEALVKAYDKAATPKEIDPFVLRLHSPKQAIARELAKFLPNKIDVRDQHGKRPTGADIHVNGGGMKIETSWVYRFDPIARSKKTVELGRNWRRFTENIDRAAA